MNMEYRGVSIEEIRVFLLLNGWKKARVGGHQYGWYHPDFVGLTTLGRILSVWPITAAYDKQIERNR